MKRKYIFNWEIKNIEPFITQPCPSTAYKINLYNGIVYVTDKYNVENIYTTFLVQPENIFDDKETVLINA